MKILHVINSLQETGGGPMIFLKTLVKKQQIQGSLIHVLSTTFQLSNKEKFSLCNDKNYILFAPWTKYLFSISLLLWLIRNINHYDVVHIHGLYRFPVMIAALLSRFYKIPYIIRPHGSLDPYLHKQSQYSVNLKRLHEKMFDFPNIEAANKIHFTSKIERNKVSFLNLKIDSFVLSNGIEISKFKKTWKGSVFKKKYCIPREKKVVSFVGRMNFKKGLDLLIHAFSLIKDENVILVIAGNTNDEYSLFIKQLAARYLNKDKYIFLGFLNHDQKIELMHETDVFVLPSHSENFGISLIEALACGSLTAFSENVDIHMDLTSNNLGFILPMDVNCMAFELEKALASPLNTSYHRKNRVTVAKELFDINLTVQKLDGIYKSIKR